MIGRYYAIAAVVMILATGTWVAWRPGPSALPPALLGCALATSNGLLAAWLNQRALGREMQVFLRWAGIGHSLRMLALLLAVLGAFVYDVPGAETFATATLIGYVCFLAAEIAVLWRQSLGAG